MENTELQEDEKMTCDPNSNSDGSLYNHCYQCHNCYKILNDVIRLRNQLDCLKHNNMVMRKQFIIAPTLYTFYKDHLDKKQLIRSASMTSRAIIQSFNQIDYSFQEEIIQKCLDPLPNPYFCSYQFVQQFLCQCKEMCRILSSEQRLVRIHSPLYVYGDIHGNLDYLLSLAKNYWPLGMHLTPGIFLFLGNYVDHGLSSLEVLAYLFAQKIMLPEKVFLLRGYHEVRIVNGYNSSNNNIYLLEQLKKEFSSGDAYEIWNRVNDVFDMLPLAAIVDDEIFCAHGGIPIGEEEIFSLSVINTIPSPYDLLLGPQDECQQNIRRIVSDLLAQDRHLLNQGKDDVYERAVEDFLLNNNLLHLFMVYKATHKDMQQEKIGIMVYSLLKDHKEYCDCIFVDRNMILTIKQTNSCICL